MPDTGWTEVVALVAAYVISVLSTPAGISGAVLLAKTVAVRVVAVLPEYGCVRALGCIAG